MQLDAEQEVALRDIPKSCLCTICLNPMTGDVENSDPIEICPAFHYVCRKCSRAVRVRNKCPECCQIVRVCFTVSTPVKRIIQEIVDTAIRRHREQQQPAAAASADSASVPPPSIPPPSIPPPGSEIAQIQQRIRHLKEVGARQASRRGTLRPRASQDIPVLNLPPAIRQQSRGHRALALATARMTINTEPGDRASVIIRIASRFAIVSRLFEHEISLSSCRTNKRKEITAWNAAKLFLMENNGELTRLENDYNLASTHFFQFSSIRERCVHAKAYLNEWATARNMPTSRCTISRGVSFLTKCASTTGSVLVCCFGLVCFGLVCSIQISISYTGCSPLGSVHTGVSSSITPPGSLVCSEPVFFETAPSFSSSSGAALQLQHPILKIQFSILNSQFSILSGSRPAVAVFAIATYISYACSSNHRE